MDLAAERERIPPSTVSPPGSRATMTYQLLQRLQAWTEGALPAGQTDEVLAEFLDLPVWFPGTRQTLPEHPGKSLHRLHLFPGEAGSLPTLPVWLEDPAGFDPPDTAPMLQYHAGTLLVFVLTQRFNVALQDGEDLCVLRYDDLLSLRSLMLLRKLAAGEPVEPGAAPDLARLPPALQAHAAARPDIRRCWLAAIVSLAGSQAAVMLDAADAESNFGKIEALLDPLLPPGVSLTLIDAAGDFDPHIRQAIAALPPVHDAGAKPGWLSRVKQRFTPPSVPVISLDIHAR